MSEEPNSSKLSSDSTNSESKPRRRSRRGESPLQALPDPVLVPQAHQEKKASTAKGRGKKPSESIHAVAERFGITKWDLILVGDGSGSGWDIGCGWSAALVDNVTRARKMFWGGSNIGSVNVGELSAYLYPLLWYVKHHAKSRVREAGRPLLVHIISDSRTVVDEGRKRAEKGGDLKAANRPLWAAMDAMQLDGLILHWHWTERLGVELNWAADQLAGKARKSLLPLKLEDPRTHEEVSLFDLNAPSSR